MLRFDWLNDVALAWQKNRRGEFEARVAFDALLLHTGAADVADVLSPFERWEPSQSRQMAMFVEADEVLFVAQRMPARPSASH